MNNPTKQPILPNETCFNDHDRIHDALLTTKTLITSYATFASEASTDALVSLATKLLNECLEIQRELFLIMYDKGWYPLEAENPVTLQAKVQQFSGYKNQFNG